MPYTDYTVRIKILGLIESPTVQFESDPPLPQNKILTVLLFGKTLDSLDSDESTSVVRAQAAIADGAVSLASMYLLASTPVESIGYDPGTRVFTAKVKLADGTSLNVGSNLSELERIGIRKRLGHQWAVSTYLENPLNLFNNP